MNWTFIVRCVTFGTLTGVYSVALTYTTVGFPLDSGEDIFRVACLFVLAFVGGVFAFQRDPEKVWFSGPALKP